MKKKIYRISESELVKTMHPINSIAEVHLFLGRWDIPEGAKVIGTDPETGDKLLSL